MGLLNSTILDVVIGLVFVYLFLSVICTQINEWIAGGLGLRSKTLATAIEQLLDKQNGSKDPTQSFLEQFYSHPLISGMKAPGNGNLSYLPSRTFATAVIDIATSKKDTAAIDKGAITFEDLKNALTQKTTDLPDGEVKTALLALIQNANNDLNVAQKNIEQWFDDAMDRASGWYKRRTLVITILIAVPLTAMTNADSVKITRTLWKSPALRATLLEKAKKRTESPQSTVEYPDKNKPLKPSVKPTKDELDTLQMVLGWSGENVYDWTGWPQRLVGWILTIVAVSLGAPFWFDTLKKLMSIRSAGNKPEKSAPQEQTNKQAKPQAA
jgi:hypothetical protein